MFHSHVGLGGAQRSENIERSERAQTADVDLSDQFSDALNESAAELSAEESEIEFLKKENLSEKNKNSEANAETPETDSPEDIGESSDSESDSNQKSIESTSERDKDYEVERKLEKNDLNSTSESDLYKKLDLKKEVSSLNNKDDGMQETNFESAETSDVDAGDTLKPIETIEESNNKYEIERKLEKNDLKSASETGLSKKSDVSSQKNKPVANNFVSKVTHHAPHFKGVMPENKSEAADDLRDKESKLEIEEEELGEDVTQIDEELVHVHNLPHSNFDNNANYLNGKNSSSSSYDSHLNFFAISEQDRLESIASDLIEERKAQDGSLIEEIEEDDGDDYTILRDDLRKIGDGLKIDGTSIDKVSSDSGSSDHSGRDGDEYKTSYSEDAQNEVLVDGLFQEALFDVDESFVRSERDDEEYLDESSSGSNNKDLAERAIISSQGKNFSDDQGRQDGENKRNWLIEGLRSDQVNFLGPDMITEPDVSQIELEEQLLGAHYDEDEEDLEDSSAIVRRDLAEGALTSSQGGTFGGQQGSDRQNRQQELDVGTLRENFKDKNSNFVVAGSVNLGKLKSCDAVRAFDFNFSDVLLTEKPENEIDHLQRLSEEGMVALDESMIKTDWEEKESLSDALRSYSHDELNKKHSFDINKNNLTNLSSVNQKPTMDDRSKSVFGFGDSLEGDFLLDKIDLDVSDWDQIDDFTHEVDESEVESLPIDLISVDEAAVVSGDFIEQIPQSSTMEEALEALSARVFVSIPEKGAQEQVAMFFKELGPFKALQITLLREEGRLVVIVQGMDAQTQAAIRGEASRLLGELKRKLQSSNADEFVEIRGRSGQRNRNGEYDEWYIHDATDGEN